MCQKCSFFSTLFLLSLVLSRFLCSHVNCIPPSAAFLSQTMQAARCPTDELSLTNCAVVSEKDLQSGQWVVVIAYSSLHSSIWAPLQSFSRPPKHSLIHLPHLLPSIHAVTVDNLMSGCRVWLLSLFNGLEWKWTFLVDSPGLIMVKMIWFLSPFQRVFILVPNYLWIQSVNCKWGWFYLCDYI